MNKLLVEPRQKNGGFTLIEVMVSVFILSAIALMFAVTIPAAKKAAYINGQYAQAASLCQHKIDELRAIGPGRMDSFAELRAAGAIDASPTGSPYSFTATDNLDNNLNDPSQDLHMPSATGKLTITQNAKFADAMDATVTITWKPASHQAHTSTMSISAVITNQGL